MEQKLPTGWAYSTIEGLIASDGLFKDGDWVESKDQDPNGAVRLIQLADIGDGRFINKSSRYLTSQKADELNCTFLRKGDVLVARMPDPLGRACIFPLEGVDKHVTVVDVCVIRTGSSEIDNKFLMFLINSTDIRSKISALQSGSTRKRISRKNLSTIELSISPLNEQKRIVAKIEELFSELDNGISALKTAREQLKVYRQAVLKHAFEGKLTAKWREENADKLEYPEQLLARIQQERETRYQQQLEDWKAAVKAWEANGKEGKKPGKPSKPARIIQATNEDLPELPTGWVWIEYAGICEQIRNGISAKPSGDSGDKIFRISAVRAMEFNLDDVRYLQDPDGQYHDYFLSKGDLVFARYNGTRDYVGVCAEYKGDGTHLYPDKLIQTRVAVTSVMPSYLEKAINSGGSRKFMEKRIRTTAGQSGISGGDVKQMPVPICSKEEQAIIELHLDKQLSNINAINEEINTGINKAETLRQSILKKAFSGQLVPQDPNDEPASELLARIKAEKAAKKAESKVADQPKAARKARAKRSTQSTEASA